MYLKILSVKTLCINKIFNINRKEISMNPLSCPHCNHTTSNVKCDGNHSQVVCEKCGMYGPFGTETTCISKWNELPRN